MKIRLNTHAILAVILLVQFQVFGQNTSITLISSNTQEAISYANVALYKTDGGLLKGLVTDNNGVARFELNQIVNYEISFVGFETLEGQIGKGEHITLEMVEELDMLDAIVVTGQYGPQRADQSIYKIDVVDERQMEQRGVITLADALSQQTFIRLTTDPSTGTSIELQGMGGENVKYLIDGVPIVGRVAGDIDLSQINMDNVDHIEIVQGPMSVVYGTSALAGVINIITKKNTVKRNLLKANVYADNKTNYKFGLYGSAIRGNHSLNLSGNRNIFQGIDIELLLTDDNLPGDSRYMEFKPKLVHNANLEYGYTKGDFNVIVGTDFMRSELRHYTNPNPSSAIARDNYFITYRSINSFSINHKVNESLSYNILGAYTYFQRNTEDILSDLSELTHTNTGTTTTLFKNGMTRATFSLTPDGSPLNYQFGWDINYERGTGERVDDSKAKIGDFAAFASTQWQAIERLSFQPGIRFIYNTSFKAPIIPSINMYWKILDDLNFRLSYARGFRAPSLKEMYLVFVDVNHDLYGNPDLLAETTNSYNASLTYKYNWDRTFLRIEPTVYYNDGKDVITLALTDRGPNSATYFNLGGRKTLGSNFNVTFGSSNGLQLAAGYSLTGESYGEVDEMDSTRLIWTDNNFYYNLTFNSQYTFNKYKTTLMANYKLYSDTPTLVRSSINDDLYIVETEAYGDLEVTLSKQFLNDKVNVILGGKNLLDNYVLRTTGYEDTTDDGVDDSIRERPLNYGRTFFIRVNFKL